MALMIEIKRGFRPHGPKRNNLDSIQIVIDILKNLTLGLARQSEMGKECRWRPIFSEIGTQGQFWEN
jgi:hypothetical protein